MKANLSDLLKNKTGFTLIEVLVSIILSGIMVYFLYIMMLTSFQSYKTLFSVSQETNDIRVCEAYLRRSIQNASWIQVLPFSNSSQALSIAFGRRELYWNSSTSTIQEIHILDFYILKGHRLFMLFTEPFYRDDVNECNNIPNPRETAKEQDSDLILLTFVTGSDFITAGLSPISTRELLTNVKVGYYFIPSNTAGGVKRFTFVKIGVDFDDILPTGEVYRNTRLFHFIARGYGLPS